MALPDDVLAAILRRLPPRAASARSGAPSSTPATCCARTSSCRARCAASSRTTTSTSRASSPAPPPPGPTSPPASTSCPAPAPTPTPSRVLHWGGWQCEPPSGEVRRRLQVPVRRNRARSRGRRGKNGRGSNKSWAPLFTPCSRKQARLTTGRGACWPSTSLSAASFSNLIISSRRGSWIDKEEM
ncbi:hypothetical protein ACP70R_005817 [Stipagrostis hirtigluma subsp. patula]